MQSFGDLMKAYLLLNTLLATSSTPLLLNNKWLNMFIIMIVTPLIITALPRGGDIFGRLAMDAPFLMVSTLLGMGIVAGISQINKRFEKDFRDYGKTTKSTGTVLGLRAVGLLFGFLILSSERECISTIMPLYIKHIFSQCKRQSPRPNRSMLNPRHFGVLGRSKTMGRSLRVFPELAY